MKKILLIALVVFSAFMTTSCSSYYRSMKEPNVRFELNSHDYTLSEPVQGEGYALYILGIDWERLFGRKVAATNTPVMGLTSILKGAESYALFDLMAKNPGYDFVMCPQFVQKDTHFYPFYQKVTVTVTARLGKLIDHSKAPCCPEKK